MSADPGEAAAPTKPEGFPAGVFTIPAGVRFIDALARGLLQAAGGGETLAATTVLLPNRRSCAALADAFARHSEAEALLLPEIAPVGDIDDEEGVDPEDLLDSRTLETAPAIPELRRQLLLTHLILSSRTEEELSEAGQAARLAQELARFLDQVQTERLGFDGLESLVPAELAEHWQVTLRFLRLATEHWPAILEEEGATDPALRRDRLIARRLQAWRERPPGPVVVAGTTGSVPATRDLMAWVSRHETGAVVLPGLDRGIGKAAWEALDPAHPQFGLKRVLEELGRTPAEVGIWPGAEPTATAAARERVIAAAMRPAGAPPEAVDPEVLETALAGVSRISCPGPREEACTIALLLREALETEGKTAALVTRDRGLARRVAAELRRWGIEIDDSGGRRLDLTPAGSFLAAISRLIAERWAPVPVLAALKHPLAAGGRRRGFFLRCVRRLERDVLRGPRPEPGGGGLSKALAETGPPPWLASWLEEVRGILAPLERLVQSDSGADVADFAAAHAAAAEALAATDEAPGKDRLWKDESGDAAAAFLSELAESGRGLRLRAGAEWPGLVETLMRTRVVRPRRDRHSRLAIRGVLEARLIGADRIVLGGLNEGSWPAEPAGDPWMSRPMRQEFGLPPPERRIGLVAHDFAQAFAAPEVFLTRATRVEGTPTIPSRWLLRLENAMPDASAVLDGEAGQWAAWQAALDRPPEPVRMPFPRPCPPVAARPRQLSATQIETLIRDPYAVYARHVLALRALDPIDADPGPPERGMFVHAALAEFLDKFPGDLGDDATAALFELGREVLDREGLAHRPGVRAFWWPRFERVATWFLDLERERRPGIDRSFAEISGVWEFDAPAGRFKLTARADRIDLTKDGTIDIVDYKTGTPPAKRNVLSGAAPQLVLEAAIAEAGGFEGVPARPVSELAYWRLSGGEPPGEIVSVGGADPDPDLVSRVRDRIETLIAAYDDPEMPYLPQPESSLAPRYSDYLHLERLAEYAPDPVRTARR